MPGGPGAVAARAAPPHLLVGHPGPAHHQEHRRRAARPARKQRPGHRARRGRRVRRQGRAVSRGCGAVPDGAGTAGHAGQVGRGPRRAPAGRLPRPRPPLPDEGGFHQGRRPAGAARRHHLQRRRVLRLPVDRRDRAADGGRAAQRPLPAGELRLHGARRGHEHRACRSVSGRRPPGQRLRHGVGDRLGGPRAGSQRRADPPPQLHPAGRHPLPDAVPAGRRLRALRGLPGQGGRAGRLRRAGPPRRAATARSGRRAQARRRLRLLQRADRAGPGRLGRAADAVPHRP